MLSSGTELIILELKNFRGEGFRGRRWEPEAHSDMPKVAELRLSTARPCVCEQDTAGPSDPVWA